MPPISVNPTEKTNRILCNYSKVLKSLADWITHPAVHEVGCEAFWGLGFGIKLHPKQPKLQLTSQFCGFAEKF
jgi:hypothetical protein